MINPLTYRESADRYYKALEDRYSMKRSILTKDKEATDERLKQYRLSKGYTTTDLK